MCWCLKWRLTIAVGVVAAAENLVEVDLGGGRERQGEEESRVEGDGVHDDDDGLLGGDCSLVSC